MTDMTGMTDMTEMIEDFRGVNGYPSDRLPKALTVDECRALGIYAPGDRHMFDASMSDGTLRTLHGTVVTVLEPTPTPIQTVSFIVQVDGVEGEYGGYGGRFNVFTAGLKWFESSRANNDRGTVE
jgi:hypothetical protein